MMVAGPERKVGHGCDFGYCFVYEKGGIVARYDGQARGMFSLVKNKTVLLTFIGSDWNHKYDSNSSCCRSSLG